MADIPPQSLYELLEKERRERIEKTARSEEGIAGAGLLLAYAAAKAEIRPPLNIIRDPKPRLEGQRSGIGGKFEFSLSHTKGLSLCATSLFPVGTDAELIRPVAPKLYKRLNIPFSNDNEGFFRYWTAFESVYKLFGGKYGLFDIALKEREGGFTGPEGCTVKTIREGEHIISVAGALPITFTKISATELESALRFWGN